jgi:hypothetical protein
VNTEERRRLCFAALVAAEPSDREVAAQAVGFELVDPFTLAWQEVEARSRWPELFAPLPDEVARRTMLLCIAGLIHPLRPDGPEIDEAAAFVEQALGQLQWMAAAFELGEETNG